MKIYTTGYTDKKIDYLKPMLETVDALLIDIRFAPVSRQHQWNQSYLQLLLKSRYQHVRNLGNRTYKENRVEIQNMELGIRTVLSFESNLVLMCGCKELRQCHRFVVMNEFKKKGFEIEEIEDWRLLEPSLF